MSDRAHFSSGFFHFGDTSVDLSRVTGFSGKGRISIRSWLIMSIWLALIIGFLAIAFSAKTGPGTARWLMSAFIVFVWIPLTWYQFIRRWFIRGLRYQLQVVTQEGSMTFMLPLEGAQDIMDDFRDQLEAVQGGAAEE